MTFDDAKLTGSTHVFSSVRVPKEAWPPYDPKGKTILAMWGLANFGAKGTAKIPVTLDVTGQALGLVASEKLTLFAVDADSGQLTDPTPATASNDATKVTTDVGEGVTRLTWLVLAR